MAATKQTKKKDIEEKKAKATETNEPWITGDEILTYRDYTLNTELQLMLEGEAEVRRDIVGMDKEIDQLASEVNEINDVKINHIGELLGLQSEINEEIDADTKLLALMSGVALIISVIHLFISFFQDR